MKCLECNEEFEPKKETSKFCCNACRQKAFRNASKPASVTLATQPKYPQGFCHACGKPNPEVFKETMCICLNCTDKNITHESLRLEMCKA